MSFYQLSSIVLFVGSLLFLQGSQEIETPNIIVVFTDDQGYADVGAYGMAEDIRTPHIDQLAADGVRMNAGYVTAPQCTPSRAGIISGRYQQRFGLDGNADGPMDIDEITIAERLGAVGYTTGMVGKWHLEPNPTSKAWLDKHFPQIYKMYPKKIPMGIKRPYTPMEQGFDDVFWGNMNGFTTDYTLNGDTLPKVKHLQDRRFRVDVQTEAALTFIDLHQDDPFFLYLSYFAPHVPLGANEKYLSRFSEDMPVRRRYALAMMSAMDDGVGQIRAKLDSLGLTKNTLIFFISDNGAPLDLSKQDKPDIDKASPTWNGSINDPWIGEKGMLTEAGIRIPYIMCWPETLPKGKVYKKAVSSLDVASTAIALAGAEPDEFLDGVNLMPYVQENDDNEAEPHDYLYWRFGNQAAVRHKNWKYLYLSDGTEYLFDVEGPDHEKRNLITNYPKLANELREALSNWADDLETPGLPQGPISWEEQRWYDYFMKKEIKGRE